MKTHYVIAKTFAKIFCCFININKYSMPLLAVNSYLLSHLIMVKQVFLQLPDLDTCIQQQLTLHLLIVKYLFLQLPDLTHPEGQAVIQVGEQQKVTYTYDNTIKNTEQPADHKAQNESNGQ